MALKSSISIYQPDLRDFSDGLAPGRPVELRWDFGSTGDLPDTGVGTLTLPSYLKFGSYYVGHGIVKSVEVTGKTMTVTLDRSLGGIVGARIWVYVIPETLPNLPEIPPQGSFHVDLTLNRPGETGHQVFDHFFHMLYTRLELTSDAVEPVQPGDDITYTLRVPNYPHGSIHSSSIVLTAPYGTDIVPDTYTGAGSATVVPTDNRLTFNYGENAPREHVVTFRVKVRERSAMSPSQSEITANVVSYRLAIKTLGGDFNPQGTSRRTLNATAPALTHKLEPLLGVTLGLSRRGVPVNSEFLLRATLHNPSTMQATQAKLKASTFEYEGEGEAVLVAEPAAGLTLAPGASGVLEYRFKATKLGKLRVSAIAQAQVQTYQAFTILSDRATSPRLGIGMSGVEAEIILPIGGFAVNAPIEAQVEFTSYEEAAQTVSLEKPLLVPADPNHFEIEAEPVEPFVLTGDNPVLAFPARVIPKVSGVGVVRTEAKVESGNTTKTIFDTAEIAVSPLQIKLTALPMVGGKSIVNMKLREDGVVTDEAGNPITPKLKVAVKNLSTAAVNARLESIDPRARDRAGIATARIAVPAIYPVELGSIPGGATVVRELAMTIVADGRFDFSAKVSGISEGTTTRFSVFGSGAPIAVGDPYPVELEFDFVRRANITGQNNGAFLIVPGSSIEVFATITNLTTNSTIEFDGIRAEKHLNAFDAVLTSDEANTTTPPFDHHHEVAAAGFVILRGKIQTDPDGAPAGTVKWEGLENGFVKDDLTGKKADITEDDILLTTSVGGWLGDDYQVRIIQDHGQDAVPPNLSGIEQTAYFSYGAMLGIGQWMYDNIDAIGGLGRLAGSISADPSLLANAMGNGSRAVWESAEYAALGWSSMTPNEKDAFMLEVFADVQRRIPLMNKSLLPFDSADVGAALAFTRQATYGFFDSIEGAYASDDPARIAQTLGTVSGNIAAEVVAAALPTPKFTRYVKGAEAGRLVENTALGKAHNVQEAFLRAVKSGEVNEATTIKHWGLGGLNLTDIKTVFAHFGVKGYMRERAPEAYQLIDILKEAIWKPEAMKPKGLSDIDLLILDNDLPPILGKKGKPLNPKGITAIFMPDEDDVIKARLRAKGHSDDVVDAALRRAQMRREEFEKYVPEFESWKRPISEGGGMPIDKNYKDNGIPNPADKPGLNRAFTFDRHRRAGKPTVYIPKMMDEAGTGFRYISGDIDWIHFTFMDGTPLDSLTASRLYNAMSRFCGFQHPETITWIKEGQTVFKGKISQITDYLTGQKALLEVSGEGTRAVRINQNLTRFGKTGREHIVNFDGGLKSRARATLADIEHAFAFYQEAFPDRRVFFPWLWSVSLADEEPVGNESPVVNEGPTGSLTTQAAPNGNVTALNWSYVSSATALIVRPKDATSVEVFNGTSWVATPVSALPSPLELTPASHLAKEVAAGAKILPLLNLPDMYPSIFDSRMKNWFAPGQTVLLGPGEATEETAVIVALSPLTLSAPLQFAHPAGTLVAAVPGTGPSSSEETDPGLKLTSKAGKVSTDFIVRGTATDDQEIARIEVSLNGSGPFLTAIGEPVKGSRPFSLGLPLENGKNTIVVTAFDFSGNASKTISTKVTFANVRPELAGVYQGIVKSTGLQSRERAGFLSISVTATGLFTGKLSFGASTHTVTGLFDNAGVARFKFAGDTVDAPTTFTLVRKARPEPIELGTLELSISAGFVSAVITDGSAAPIATSVAARSHFDGKTPETTVDAAFLENKGRFTVIFPARGSQPGLTDAEFPQGTGIATITLTKKGSVKLAGKLADGTPLAASAALSEDYAWPLFANLHKGGGVFAGDVSMDAADAESDGGAFDALWIRPAIPGATHYANGWPEGLFTDLQIAKFNAVPGTLPGLSEADPVLGNATLSFAGLSGSLAKGVTILPTSKVENTPADSSFQLKISASTGTLKGFFGRGNPAVKTKWEGVIFQKGARTGGHGYYLSVEPRGSDAGESGSVSLLAR